MDETSAAVVDRLTQSAIAFVIPGGVVLFAASTRSETISTWLSGAQSGPTLGGVLFVLLAAFALGLIVSAMRYVLFERVSIRGRRMASAATPVAETNRKNFAAEYADLRRSHYDHYLASANLAVALPMALGLVAQGATVSRWTLVLAAGLVMVLSGCLMVAARDALKRYDEKRERLLGRAVA